MAQRNPPFPVEEAAALDEPGRAALQPLPALLAALELQPDSCIVELGCGTGYFTEALAAELVRRGGEGRIVALDLQPAMLAATRTRLTERGLLGPLQLRQVAPERPNHLPLETGSADRALLANVYLELQDPRATLLEVRRVLRPGGLLVVLDWDPEGETRAGPPPSERPDPGRVQADLVQAGFRSVTELPISPGAFGLRACNG